MNQFSALPSILAAALVLAGSHSAPAAEVKPRLLDKSTFFQMESISNPEISPDGGQVVFARGFADMTRDQQQSNLWIVDVRGERLRQLSDGAWRDSGPAWSPDGRRIAFLSNRSGSSQIHVMWVDTRETLQLTRVERDPGNLRWSPDGRRIAFTMSLQDESPVLPVKLPAIPKGAQLAKGPVVVDRTTWGADGVGPTTRTYTHVFTIDATVGGTPKQITQGKYNHGACAWSADGRTLFVSGIRKPDAEYLRGDSEIYAVSIETGEARPLTDRKGPDANPVVSPDGKWIAFTGYDEKNFTSHLSSLYLMDTSGGLKRLWAGGLPSSPRFVGWAAEGSGAYYSMQERGEENLFFIALKEGSAPRKVTAGAHLLAQVSLARNGAAVGIRSTVAEPGTLVAFNVAKPAEMRVLVEVNQDVLEGVKLATWEELWFTAPDGIKSQGWLMKPTNFEAGRKYPLVLYIHGGPWSMYHVGWNWAWQNFAANGYAVLWMNPRGSTGYGQEFVNGIQFSYPGGDYDDLMAGVDAALAKGFVDKDNLFVCGGSGGGLLTAWVVGKTPRFRAAVSMRPVIDWASFVGTTDGSNWYHQFRKYPWEDPMEYAQRSPLNLVGNVSTPTMVMTGEADLRTPISQSEEYYRALKMLRKVDTLLVRMPEEFHGWRRPSHQLLQQLYLLAWFEKHRTAESRKAIPAVDHAGKAE
jgi:dipeptidyl aminopeptidase/acylaminoacyl peptidase